VLAFKERLLPLGPPEADNVVLPEVKAEVSRYALRDVAQHEPLAIREVSQRAEHRPVARAGLDQRRRSLGERRSSREELRQEKDDGAAQQDPDRRWELVESLHRVYYERRGHVECAATDGCATRIDAAIWRGARVLMSLPAFLPLELASGLPSEFETIAQLAGTAVQPWARNRTLR